jgi:NitT/TauT family transport system substrate-binding protein
MKKIVALLLTLSLLAALPLLTGCQKYDEDLDVRVWTLNGTTGFGMGPLIEDDKAGSTALNYTFTVETQATNVRDALINGTADIGALPTNVASALYNSTKGEVLLLALNTRGVLYLVTNTGKAAAPASLAELSGKTVYVPAQNPTFITKALLEKASVANVTLDSTTYAEPAALQGAVVEGLVDYAVLPEPLLTAARAQAAKKNVALSQTALDLTAEWDKAFTAGSLVQGCVVVRKAFATEHPGEVAKFLEEYEASVNYVIQNPKEAAEKIVAAGIFANAAVAEKAIPKCNLCFVKGADMKPLMNEFLAVMPVNAIGGKVPDDGFYYVAQ